MSSDNFSTDELSGDAVWIHDSVIALRTAAHDDDPARREIALDGIRSIILSLATFRPDGLSKLFPVETAAGEKAPHPTVREVERVVGQLCAWLGEADIIRQSRAVFWILDMNAPGWSRGGESHFGHCVPVETIAETALAFIDSDAGDFCTGGAIILGMYGPDADAYLGALLEKLDKHWQDCMRAPGITWAVYQIGGLRPSVKERMLKIATHARACSHSQHIARRILKMNEVEF